MKNSDEEKILGIIIDIKLNPIQDGGGGGKKALPTSFSPVTSTNVRISPKNFLALSINRFATLV